MPENATEPGIINNGEIRIYPSSWLVIGFQGGIALFLLLIFGLGFQQSWDKGGHMLSFSALYFLIGMGIVFIALIVQTLSKPYRLIVEPSGRFIAQSLRKRRQINPEDIREIQLLWGWPSVLILKLHQGKLYVDGEINGRDQFIRTLIRNNPDIALKGIPLSSL